MHLFLTVKVREGWLDDPERYRAMGLEFPEVVAAKAALGGGRGLERDGGDSAANNDRIHPL